MCWNSFWRCILTLIYSTSAIITCSWLHENRSWILTIHKLRTESPENKEMRQYRKEIHQQSYSCKKIIYFRKNCHFQIFFVNGVVTLVVCCEMDFKNGVVNVIMARIRFPFFICCKGGLFSESFSLWFKSSKKKCAKLLPWALST